MSGVLVADCNIVGMEIGGTGRPVDLVYADILYDEPDKVPLTALLFSLRPGGAFFLQTDYRSVAQLKLRLDACGMIFTNWIIWAYDWGGRTRDSFGKKHDDILYYIKPGGKKTFNAKAVAEKKKVLINSKKDWKIPTDVWTGNFFTTSRERIKDTKTGKGFIWQKPEWLLERIILSATNEGDIIFEPYLGTGTACAVAKRLGRRYVGCDRNKRMVAVAKKRLKGVERTC